MTLHPWAKKWKRTAQKILIALEHELKAESSGQEVHKLSIYSIPIKILITYPEQSQIPSLLQSYEQIINYSNDTSSKWLIIFGIKSNKIEWIGYKLIHGKFLRLQEDL